MEDTTLQFEFDFRQWLKKNYFDESDGTFKSPHPFSGVSVDLDRGIQADEWNDLLYCFGHDGKNLYGFYRLGEEFACVLLNRRLKIYMVQPNKRRTVMITDGDECLFLDSPSYTVHGVPLFSPNALFELKKISPDVWYEDYYFRRDEAGSWVEHDETIENMIDSNNSSVPDEERDCWFVCSD